MSAECSSPAVVPCDAALLRSPDEIADIARAGVARPYCGEVRVWAECGYVTRIYFFDRRIAWVHCNRWHKNLGEVLLKQANVTRSSLRRAMTHARATGVNLGEAFVALRILPIERLRLALRDHVQDHIHAAFRVDDVLAARFTPLDHRYNATLTFDVDELHWGANTDSSPCDKLATPVVSPSLARVCEEAVGELPGALLVGMLDLDTNRVMSCAARRRAVSERSPRALEVLLHDVLARLEAVGHFAMGPGTYRFIQEIGLGIGDVHCTARIARDGRTCLVLVTDERCPSGAASAHLRAVVDRLERHHKESEPCRRIEERI